MNTGKKLYKSREERAIFGVCGGLAEYLDIDVIVVRLLVVVFSIPFAMGIVAYIIAAIVMPERPSEATQRAYQSTYGGESHGGESHGGESHGGESHGGAETEETYDTVGADFTVNETGTKPSSFYQNRSGRNSTAVLIGLLLVGLGVYLLLRIFVPYFDTRIFMAIALILLGIFVIAKK